MIGGTTTNTPYIYIHEADVLKIQSIGLFVYSRSTKKEESDDKKITTRHTEKTVNL